MEKKAELPIQLVTGRDDDDDNDDDDRSWMKRKPK